MKMLALGLLLLLQQGMQVDRTTEVEAAPQVFRYERAVGLPPAAQGQSCVVLDAPVFAHTGGELSGLRMYRRDAAAGMKDVPFVTTESGEAGQQEEQARVMNLGRKGRALVFDLAMPHRAYTDVVLDLDAQDFTGQAKVSGGDTVGHTTTELGEYALFDLSARRLSRSTTLGLQETSFAVLHVELMLDAAPGSPSRSFGAEVVKGASVPPSRFAQTLYTTVASTTALAQKGRETVAVLQAAGHVPVERVRFVLDPEFGRNFSRLVKITARPEGASDEGSSETAVGTIQRVHMPADAMGVAIRQEQMTVEAVLGANLRKAAQVEVAIENGDDTPLPVRAVELEMRQHDVCFDAEAGANYVMRYGSDARIRPAVYDYARLFRPSAKAVAGTLGAEALNPAFHGGMQQMPYMARHPEIIWIVLLITIAVLGGTAVHSAKVASKR